MPKRKGSRAGKDFGITMAVLPTPMSIGSRPELGIGVFKAY